MSLIGCVVMDKELIVSFSDLSLSLCFVANFYTCRKCATDNIHVATGTHVKKKSVSIVARVMCPFVLRCFLNSLRCIHILYVDVGS